MPIDLNHVWYLLVGALLAGYAALDGFDLGVGSLYLLAKKDEHRRIFLNSIGPVWDGNEVWLVTGGGALFAAFPNVYATVFSGFYLAFVLLLAALIFRAVAIEFRSKQPMRWWRQMWDIGFSGGSILSSLLIGVAMGNIAWGVPIDANGEYAGTFLGLLGPYPLLLGAFAGLANVVPFVGPLLSAAAAGLVVVLTPGQGLAGVGRVVLLFLVIKVLDDTIIQPFTIGRSVHLHPALLLGSVVVGSHALGVLGMIIAVPVATVLQETVRLLLEHRRVLARRDRRHRPSERLVV